MVTIQEHKVSLYVDRSRAGHWVVRDPDGNFWIVPPTEDAWERREPFRPTDETELEPIPRHYLSVLGLPF